jgi:hypothetical protein
VNKGAIMAIVISMAITVGSLAVYDKFVRKHVGTS